MADFENDFLLVSKNDDSNSCLDRIANILDELLRLQKLEFVSKIKLEAVDQDTNLSLWLQDFESLTAGWSTQLRILKLESSLEGDYRKWLNRYKSVLITQDWNTIKERLKGLK